MMTRDIVAVALSVFTDLLRVNKHDHVTVQYYGNCIEVDAFYDITDDSIISDREAIEKDYQIQGHGIIVHYTTTDGDDFQTLRFHFEND